MVLAPILYPNVIRAFQLIEVDNGMVNRLEPQKTIYTIPSKYFEMAIVAEGFLAKLTEEQFENFCVGEYDEQTLLRKQSSDGETAAQFLDLFFNNWEETDD